MNWFLQELADIAAAFWTTLGDMAPYLLFGFLVAGILSAFLSPELVERHLGGRGLWASIKAAAIGVPLPLCSCGVIPVAASLRRHGAGKGAVTSFLISTPETGVDSILVTWSLLGPVLAVLRPVAAFLSGVLGGWVVDRLDGDAPTAGDRDPATPSCTDECCQPAGKRSRWQQAFRHGFVTLPADLARPMLLGLLAAGVISAMVPEDFFAGRLGTGFTGMLVMMAVGIPLYVCASASVPIAASLILKGVSPGAAMVFLMTGPATNAATISVIWKMMGRRTTVIYLAVIAFASLAFGILVDTAFAGITIPLSHHGAHSMPGRILNTASAIALLAVLAWPLVHSWARRGQGPSAPVSSGHAKGAPDPDPMHREMTAVLRVQGMTCRHCVQSITQALRACHGVADVQVDLKRERAVIAGTALSVHDLCAAVQAAGYEAQPAQDDSAA